MPKIRIEQHDFRSYHSTNIQLLSFVDELVLSANKRPKTAIALLDVKKVFNKVLHRRLIHKLIQL